MIAPPPIASRSVPVTILTGFLGAGKTTLLNRILTENHGRRIAVTENEFGEIDVDSDLVLTSEEEIFQMTNGCICCVADVRNDLVELLRKLMARRERFDHILVETSGLADPTPVATAFFVDPEIARQVALDAIVAMVDAAHIESHLDDPGLAGADNQAVDQLVVADRVVVNKIDLVDEPRLRAVEERIRSLNETADIVRSSYARIDLDNILGIGAFTPPPALSTDPDFLDEHAHRHAHDPSVDSVALVLDEPLDRARLEAELDRLLRIRGDDVYRLKGILRVAGDDRRYVLQGVHRLIDIQPGVPWGGERPSSKIVFIGRGLDRPALEALLDACRARSP